MVEKQSYVTRDKSQRTSHSRQSHCNGQVIYNNSIALDHFPLALDQEVTFSLALDIVAKNHFPTSVIINTWLVITTLNIKLSV